MPRAGPDLFLVDPVPERSAALLRALGARGLEVHLAADLTECEGDPAPRFCASEAVASGALLGALAGAGVRVYGFGSAPGANTPHALAGFLAGQPDQLPALIAAAAAAEPRPAPAAHQLFAVTLLSESLDVDRAMRQIASAFGADNCCLVDAAVPRPDRIAAAAPDDPALALLTRAEAGCHIGLPCYLSVAPEAEPCVLCGCRLHPPGRSEVGTLWLIDHRPRQLSPEQRRTFELFADRLANELWWISAHNRLVIEHDKLRESAPTDATTDLWARDAFEQLATAEIAAAQRRRESVALALLDVVGLRQINDRHGHRAGDAVIAHFARVVRAHLRASDLVGRFGGDEIAVVLAGVNLEVARKVTAKLVDAVAETPAWYQGERIDLAIRAGLTDVDTDDRNGETAYRRVQAALNQARRAGCSIATSQPDDSAGTSADEVASGDAALPAGTTLGGMYRILHELSRGAMGVVYRGEDLGLGRAVAIKVLRSDLARDNDLVSFFRREAATLASIHHRHLVQVYSFGSEQDEVYFVMELVEGESLADVLTRLQERSDHIELPVIAQVLEEIADALEAMHGAGVIHRDVKPANILLDEIGDRAVLVDVGVAKRGEDRSVAAGTPGFAAPESFTDQAESPATDVYGIAATIYTALTGMAPFGGGTILEIIERQLEGPPPPPSQLRPGLSHAVDQVLAKALAPDPSARYDSAATFAVALSSALRRAPAMAGSEPPRPRPARPAAAPDPGLSMTLQGAQAVAALAGGVRLTRGAVFRVAHKLFTHHLGSAWLRRLCEHDEALADVFRSNLSPTSWRPLELLLTALERSTPVADKRIELARVLGRAVMTVTFARFFGADPASMPPLALLRAAAACWSRYHSWGQLEVDGSDGGAAGAVTLLDSPGDPAVCALVAGHLVRIAELAGANGVSIEETACACHGGSACRFELAWSATGATARGR